MTYEIDAVEGDRYYLIFTCLTPYPLFVICVSW